MSSLPFSSTNSAHHMNHGVKDGWREVTLGEIFDISSSKRVLQEQWRTAGVPFYRAREIVKLAESGSVSNELFISEEHYEKLKSKYGVPKPGDLMVSAVGTLGACYVVRPSDRFYFKDASVLRFSPKQSVCSRFIWHAFRTNDIIDQVHAGSGSTVGTYTIARASETRLWMPPLPEQRRIAEILDKADALRAKRRAAVAQLDTLTQSVFLDMFGDPETNPKRWRESKLLGDVADIASGVTIGRKLNGKSTRSVPYLAVVNVQDGFLDLAVKKATKATEDEIQRYRLLRNDILLTEGGDPDKLGRGALWADQLPECIHQNHVFRVRLRSSELTPLFLNWLIGSQRGKRYFLRSAKQTTGIASINMTQLRAFPLIIPPLSLQREFADRIAACGRLESAYSVSLVSLDDLFSSLQHRAFRCEPTTANSLLLASRLAVVQ